MNETELKDVDFGTYTEEEYFDDMGRLTQYRCDPDMTEILIRQSFATAVWMREQGVRFQLGLGRQAFRVDGKFKFWGGLACHIWGGGKELMKALHARAAGDGITVLYETPAIGLLQGDIGVEGVRVRHQGRIHDLRAKAVVLACGGFEANAEMRARYLRAELGPRHARLASIRARAEDGPRFGRRRRRHWSGAPSPDLNAPPFGDLISATASKHNYPFGTSSTPGRALDEGLDFHSYTYAKYGGEILTSPDVRLADFDQKVVHLLREEYRIRASPGESRYLEALAGLEGVEPAVSWTRPGRSTPPRPEAPFNPNIRDGSRPRPRHRQDQLGSAPK
jgi:tricarballylate dehydrogenase